MKISAAMIQLLIVAFLTTAAADDSRLRVKSTLETQVQGSGMKKASELVAFLDTKRDEDSNMKRLSMEELKQMEDSLITMAFMQGAGDIGDMSQELTDMVDQELYPALQVARRAAELELNETLQTLLDTYDNLLVNITPAKDKNASLPACRAQLEECMVQIIVDSSGVTTGLSLADWTSAGQWGYPAVSEALLAARKALSEALKNGPLSLEQKCLISGAAAALSSKTSGNGLRTQAHYAGMAAADAAKDEQAGAHAMIQCASKAAFAAAELAGASASDMIYLAGKAAARVSKEYYADKGIWYVCREAGLAALEMSRGKNFTDEDVTNSVGKVGAWAARTMDGDGRERGRMGCKLSDIAAADVGASTDIRTRLVANAAQEAVEEAGNSPVVWCEVAGECAGNSARSMKLSEDVQATEAYDHAYAVSQNYLETPIVTNAAIDAGALAAGSGHAYAHIATMPPEASQAVKLDICAKAGGRAGVWAGSKQGEKGDSYVDVLRQGELAGRAGYLAAWAMEDYEIAVTCSMQSVRTHLLNRGVDPIEIIKAVAKAAGEAAAETARAHVDGDSSSSGFGNGGDLSSEDIAQIAAKAAKDAAVTMATDLGVTLTDAEILAMAGAAVRDSLARSAEDDHHLALRPSDRAALAAAAVAAVGIEMGLDTETLAKIVQEETRKAAIDAGMSAAEALKESIEGYVITFALAAAKKAAAEGKSPMEQAMAAALAAYKASGGDGAELSLENIIFMVGQSAARACQLATPQSCSEAETAQIAYEAAFKYCKQWSQQHGKDVKVCFQLAELARAAVLETTTVTTNLHAHDNLHSGGADSGYLDSKWGPRKQYAQLKTNDGAVICDNRKITELCDEANAVCGEWIERFQVRMFNVCESVNGGKYCAPDENFCDFRNYSSVGEHLKITACYWAKNACDWMDQKQKCDLAAAACRAENIGECRDRNRIQVDFPDPGFGDSPTTEGLRSMETWLGANRWCQASCPLPVVLPTPTPYSPTPYSPTPYSPTPYSPPCTPPCIPPWDCKTDCYDPEKCNVDPRCQAECECCKCGPDDCQKAECKTCEICECPPCGCDCDSCECIQCKLETLACKATQQGITACNNFSYAFDCVAPVYDSTFERICGEGGFRHVYQEEYEVMLRIKCILGALPEKDDGKRSQLIDGCSAAAQASHDLSPLDIPLCTSTSKYYNTTDALCPFKMEEYWSADQANCLAFTNLKDYGHCPGGAGVLNFENYYYEYIAHPAKCENACRILAPPAHVPPACRGFPTGVPPRLR